MMKHLLIAAATTVVLAGGLAGGAAAADLRGPLQDTPPPYGLLPAYGPYNWTGGYIGANIGFGGGEDHYNTSVNNNNYISNNYGNNDGNNYGPYGSDNYGYNNYQPASFNASAGDAQRSNGVIGGVQAGYNYQLGNFGGVLGGFGGGLLGGYAHNIVVGVEADFDGTGIASGGPLSSFAQGFPLGTSQYVGVSSQIDYLGTVRGRLGYAFDRVLVYGTGGFAYANVKSTVNAPGQNISTSSSQFHTGYVFGGGVEVAVSNNVALRAEYLRAELDSRNIASGNNGYISYNVSERPEVNIVRAGLDYKFGVPVVAAPPVIARY